ncbi:hypothetical protein B0A50_00722 [Salinomyces thailandicus]|uniref:Uncharacterized protein n=1 Tax=Salinomyces thailandicus TaxID=706561 RepID=A0A4V6WJY1_9PEZI|nr:hypothetical protein B0A50_00722 [Salinomyces thailandica]
MATFEQYSDSDSEDSNIDFDSEYSSYEREVTPNFDNEVEVVDALCEASEHERADLLERMKPRLKDEYSEGNHPLRLALELRKAYNAGDLDRSTAATALRCVVAQPLAKISLPSEATRIWATDRKDPVGWNIIQPPKLRAKRLSPATSLSVYGGERLWYCICSLSSDNY